MNTIVTNTMNAETTALLAFSVCLVGRPFYPTVVGKTWTVRMASAKPRPHTLWFLVVLGKGSNLQVQATHSRPTARAHQRSYLKCPVGIFAKDRWLHPYPAAWRSLSMRLVATSKFEHQFKLCMNKLHSFSSNDILFMILFLNSFIWVENFTM